PTARATRSGGRSEYLILACQAVVPRRPRTADLPVTCKRYPIARIVARETVSRAAVSPQPAGPPLPADPAVPGGASLPTQASAVGIIEPATAYLPRRAVQP